MEPHYLNINVFESGTRDNRIRLLDVTDVVAASHSLLDLTAGALERLVIPGGNNIELGIQLQDWIKEYSVQPHGWYFVRAYPIAGQNEPYIEESGRFNGQIPSLIISQGHFPRDLDLRNLRTFFNPYENKHYLDVTMGIGSR
ncbi:MAG: hypothetical protein ACOCWQ_03580 [Nanoarchaeota archaeon]